MKQLLQTTALASLLAMPLAAQTNLDEDHADIGINYEGAPTSAWDLHVHDEENNLEYEPDEAIFRVFDSVYQQVVNANVATQLGITTSDFAWILPQSDPGEGSGILFLGIGAEELAPDIFVDNQVTVSLSLLTGPSGGAFAAYQNAPFGAIANVNGITLDIDINDHEHFNYAFTEKGTYFIEVTASGTLTLAEGGGFISDSAVYQFDVIPEPSTYALLALGLGALALLRRNNRRSS